MDNSYHEHEVGEEQYPDTFTKNISSINKMREEVVAKRSKDNSDNK